MFSPIYIYIYIYIFFFLSAAAGDSGYCSMNSSHIFLTFSSLYHIVGSVHCLWDPQISLFSNFFIKNEFYDIIYTFKNYFATVFSDSIFSFNNNKFNPNGSSMFVRQKLFLPTYFIIQLIFATISEFHNTF